MLQNSILRLFYSLSMIISFYSISTMASGITAIPQGTPWIGLEFGNETGNYKIANTTSGQIQIDGIRINIPGDPGTVSDGGNSFSSCDKVNDGNGSDRYQVNISDQDDGGKPMNVFNSLEEHTFSFSTTGIADGVNWTPTSPQFLVKTGSLAEQKINKDIYGLTLHQLDSISHNDPNFYNENHFVLDTLGIHGSKWGAGFVDTWFNQETEEPIWQIQVGLPEDTVRIWGVTSVFEPQRMDSRDGTYGVGPLFLMGAALAQEYMNVDMQYLLGTSFQESNAGLVRYEWEQTWDPDSGTYFKKKDLGIQYYNHNTNPDQQRGPMHFIEASYKSYVYEGYPKFFPYDATYQPSPKYVTTPQTGGCELNSPQVGNAYFLSTLYMWYTWQLVVSKLGEKALELFETSPNREIAAMMVSWAWNKGFNGGFATYCNNPDPNKDIRNDIDYVDFVWNGVDYIEEGNRNVTINGGTDSIYDEDITLVELERLFFGEGGNPSAGTLGTAGILHHFKHTDAQRQLIWSEIDSAFQILKGRAPSTKGRDAISYRYDYLGVLRIVKKFLDLSIPVPKVGEFKTWITITEPDPNAKSSDKTYPHLVINDKNKVGNTVQVKTSVTDNRFLNIDSAAVVEWTLDPDWGAINWNAAVKESGADTLSANYTANMDQRYINDNLPSGVDTGIAWIRVSDANFNSTLDTVHVIRDENIIVLDPPVFDSSIAIDNNGDGMADAIELYLTKAAGGEELSNYSNMKYSWPTSTNLVPPSLVSGTTSPLSVTDPGKLTGGNGTGKIEFSYNNTDYSKDVYDRVGPAIITGEAKLELGSTSSDNDVLTIKFTENVASFSKSDLVLAFKKSNGDIDSVTISVENLSGSNDTWTFDFKNGDLKEYNWVKIVSNSNLKDSNGNNAAENNQLVEIEKSGGNIPTWSEGIIEDEDGDGFGDKITYTITPGSGDNPLNFSDVDLIKYKFHTMPSEITVATTDITPSKSSATNTISFNVTSAETNNYTGTDDGDASVNLTSGAESFTLSEKIKDKVGPAVSIAEFIVTEDSSPCTLKISLTEAVEDFSDISKAWFKINGSAIKAQSIIKDGSNGKNWIFILNSGDISDGDKISLISTSGMVDKSAQKNPPKENETDVILKYLSSLIEVQNVEYYDINANGIMDLVSVIFKTSVDQEDDIENMSFNFTWLDNTNNPISLSVDGIEFSKKGDNAAEWFIDESKYDLKGDLTVLGDNYGEMSLTQLDPEDSTKTVKTDYDKSIAVDQMAPVIIKADYFINKSEENTLTITYSEKITTITSSTSPFNEKGGTKSFSFKQEMIPGAFTPSININYIKEGGDNPAAGDSININSAANITGNVPQNNPSNKYCPINIYEEVEITEVSYHEESSYHDGYIDFINVKTDMEISETMFEGLAAAIALNTERDFESIDKSDFSLLSDKKGFKLKVTQAEGTAKNTSCTHKDSLFITDRCSAGSGFIRIANYKILDSLAPVITVAIISPVEITEENHQDLPKDTLLVTFSEDITEPDIKSNPFSFKDKNDVAFTVDLAKESSINSKTVRFFIDYSSNKPSDSDSINIDIDGNVKDKSGNNEQNTKNNIYVPLRISPVKINWYSGVFPNPLKKKMSDKDIAILEEKLGITVDINGKNQAIIVSPLGQNSSSEDLTISIKIFDALGHIIAEDEFKNNDKIWYYLWDCKNLKGREVGSGVYIANIKILPESAGSVVKPLKLGIKN